jgi:acyl-CoA thioesterase I
MSCNLARLSLNAQNHFGLDRDKQGDFMTQHRRKHSLWVTCVGLLFVGCTSRSCESVSVKEQTTVALKSDEVLPASKQSHESVKSEPQMQVRTLVFLGDSLLAGYGLSAAQAVPARIEEKISQEGLADRWKVVNAGVSGDTTRGGLERLDWVFRSKPDVLFLCLGANDGLRGLKLDESAKNLRTIVERAQEKGVRVVLAGMRMPSNYGNTYTSQFEKIYQDLARDYNLPFYPFLLEGVALSPDLTLPDGIHPNSQGTQKMADKIWEFLKPLLAG